MKRIFALAFAIFGLAAGATQASIIPTTVSSNTTLILHSINLLNDGVIPPNGTSITDPRSIAWLASSGAVFTFDFGGPVTVASFLATVDNNDDYTVTLFDGAVPVLSRTILASDGVVPVIPGGEETFSSIHRAGATFVSDLAFSPVLATSATFMASDGDGVYGAAEVQFTNSVPEPASWAMILVGFGAIGFAARRRSAIATAL